MVQLYYILVTEGRRDIEKVPERYRADVQSMLDFETVEGMFIEI